MTRKELENLIISGCGTGDILDDLRSIYQEARPLATGPIVASEGRGEPRRELKLGPALLKALLRGHDMEEVLQRTLYLTRP